MKKWILLTALVLTGCGEGVIPCPGPPVTPGERAPAPSYPELIRPHAPEAAPFAAEFENKYGVDTNCIEIKYEYKEEYMSNGMTAGFCDGNYTIYLNPKFWTRFSETTKRNLVFHELGHCALRRQHKNEIFEDGCPRSHMNWMLIWDECYIKHAKEIDAELGAK